MATTLRATSANHSTTGTAMSVAAPTGTTTGDLVIVAVHGNGQTTIADNNGGTPFTADISNFKPNTSNGHTVSIFSRRIQAGDPSTYNFTLGATGRWSIIAATWQSPNSGTIYDVAPNTANAANRDNSDASTITAPSITTVNPNAIHVACGFIDNATSTVASHPSGYTAINTSTDEPQGMSYKVIVSPGATGTTTYTSSDSQPMIGLSFSIKTRESAALTGTAAASITETDIVNGGKTIILTLANDTWIAAGAGSFDLQRQNIINGITSAQSETFGWNLVPKALQGVAGVVRTSATVVTITLDAQATYNITAQETITVTIPATALTGGVAIVASPAFTVSTVGGVTVHSLAATGIGG
jgi:hypothetical protein